MFGIWNFTTVDSYLDDNHNSDKNRANFVKLNSFIRVGIVTNFMYSFLLFFNIYIANSK